MEHTDRMFRMVAEILEGADLESSGSSLKTYDDFVIALSLDTGLTRQEVRSRLSQELRGDVPKRHIRGHNPHNGAYVAAARKRAAENARRARLH